MTARLLAGFIVVAVAIFSFAFIVPAAKVQAVDLIGSEVCKGRANTQSSVCKEGGQNENPIFGPNGVLTYAIGLMSIVVGIAAVIMILLAGLKFITSGSNPQDVTKAREMILYAIVGLIIAALAQVVVRVFLSKL